jgi:hypothetical protein
MLVTLCMFVATIPTRLKQPSERTAQLLTPTGQRYAEIMTPIPDQLPSLALHG